MRIVALLAAFNESRFIARCLEHLHAQGVNSYLIDNESTDDTVRIAERFLGKGLIGIESLPRPGAFFLHAILRRKEALAAALEADWFMHVDIDEIRLPPTGSKTLRDALVDVSAAGYNAVNFHEFVFIPTQEAPTHDHDRYVSTMRWYYPFEPQAQHQRKAWKAQDRPIDLTSSAGHGVAFEGLNVSPVSFRLKHYLFLSVPHALHKYTRRMRHPAEVERGWGGWRNNLSISAIDLPPQSHLREYISDDRLDFSNPWKRHWLDRSQAEGSQA